MAKYHYLVQREGGRWGIQFGDYDRETVEFEREDMKRDYQARDLKIITMPKADQALIDAKIEKMNAQEAAAESLS